MATLTTDIEPGEHNRYGAANVDVHAQLWETHPLKFQYWHVLDLPLVLIIVKYHHQSCLCHHYYRQWKTPHTQSDKCHTTSLQPNQSTQNDESVASCTHEMVQSDLCLADNKNEATLGSKVVPDDPLEGTETSRQVLIYNRQYHHCILDHKIGYCHFQYEYFQMLLFLLHPHCLHLVSTLASNHLQMNASILAMVAYAYLLVAVGADEYYSAICVWTWDVVMDESDHS
mmetsp:Transcript_32670/g.66680  ORF Transcript_32670/g.66680 Transcript_32670/m.66680 type:complete len:228 (-) Transcript_32670:604-1287(-)